LTPYRGTRYHLKEWGLAGQRPENKEELFNLRHSSLRNVIERVFGVIKKRFPLLRDMKPYPIVQQAKLVLCATILNNFIIMCAGDDDDDEYNEADAETLEPQDDHGIPTQANTTSDDDEHNAAKEMRDGIASGLWTQYLDYISRNGYPEFEYFVDV